jgi:enoyl-[acyl-carrier-protein] reductase (NADH)
MEQKKKTRDEIENELSNQNSIRKLVDSSDVAALVAFLASPLSVAVTGEVIAAGGGVGTGIYY